MIKLLIDQGLPRAMARLLRDDGFDSVHTGEIDAETAADTELIRIAESQERIIITRDADFHMLLALSGAVSPSVIRIRYEGIGAEPLARLVIDVIGETRAELERGSLVTVHGGKVRVRGLPILP